MPPAEPPNIDADASDAKGEQRAQISRALVALHKQFFGIGPTEARTYIEDDLVVCVMRGGRTRLEETLQDSGRGHAVNEQRGHWQEIMEIRFTEVIERITDRKVIGFLSGNQQKPPMSAEVFVLEPSSRRA